MSEPEPYYTVEPNTDAVETRLAHLLGGVDAITKLSELIEEIIGDTRYGDVVIVIADGRVTLLKGAKSYKDFAPRLT